jgi:flagellar basal-body rod protein FlgB
VNEIDRAFLLPTRVLDWTSARARALQSNLAHAGEPGYRRVDVDFDELVKAVRKRRQDGDASLVRAQPTIEVDATAAAGPTGNTVSFEKEQVQLDKNELLHELATFIVSSKVSGLRNAIRGTAT